MTMQSRYITKLTKWGGLVTLAIAGGLALGLTSIEAVAAPDDPCKGRPADRDPECDSDEFNGEPVHLTLFGDMSTDDGVIDVLEGGLSQNSPKRLQFGNGNFGAPGIAVALGEPDGLSGICGVDPFFLGINAPTNQELLDELNGAFIDDGSVIIKIDKKNATVEFVIEYFVPEPVFSPNLPDGGNSMIRIFFREDLGRTGIFPVATGNLDFPGIMIISGSIAIWWSNLTGLNEDKILVCDDQEVTVVLEEIAP